MQMHKGIAELICGGAVKKNSIHCGVAFGRDESIAFLSQRHPDIIRHLRDLLNKYRGDIM